MLADPAAAGLQRGLSVNQKVVALPAVDAAAFVRNVNASAVRGNTLVLDFPFPAFPSNLGHWSEVVLPVHTMVEQGTWYRDCAGSSGSHGTIGVNLSATATLVQCCSSAVTVRLR